MLVLLQLARASALQMVALATTSGKHSKLEMLENCGKSPKVSAKNQKVHNTTKCRLLWVELGGLDFQLKYGLKCGFDFDNIWVIYRFEIVQGSFVLHGSHRNHPSRGRACLAVPPIMVRIGRTWFEFGVSWENLSEKGLNWWQKVWFSPKLAYLTTHLSLNIEHSSLAWTLCKRKGVQMWNFLQRGSDFI